MSRLSNAIREQMAVALVKHKFAERAAALSADSIAIFKAVHEHLYDATDQRMMKALQKKGTAFETANRIDVNGNGYSVDVGAIAIGTITVQWRPMTENLPFFKGHRGWSNRPNLDGDLGARVQQFADDERVFTEEVGTAYNRAVATLAQFTTGKKLAAEWPEAMPIIGSLIPEDDRTLPVIQLAAINADFGLPPADRLAA